MMYRRLGLDNCTGCSDMLSIRGESFCRKYKKQLSKNYAKVELKLDICTKPYKYDLSDDNCSDEESYD